jgi:hypothetical protein
LMPEGKDYSRVNNGRKELIDQHPGLRRTRQATRIGQR